MSTITNGYGKLDWLCIKVILWPHACKSNLLCVFASGDWKPKLDGVVKIFNNCATTIVNNPLTPNLATLFKPTICWHATSNIVLAPGSSQVHSWFLNRHNKTNPYPYIVPKLHHDICKHSRFRSIWFIVKCTFFRHSWTPYARLC
jgi:hypothetical protein